jgi:hypothetical protein
VPPDDGHAYGRIVMVGDAHVFEGWEIVAVPSGGHAVRFRLVVGPDFVARALEMDADGPRGVRRLSVRRDPKGHWWANGQRRSDLDAAVDLDVAATPLTNTPTIRRLALAPGASADIIVAWVDVPALEVNAVEQRYTRLDDTTYRFETGDFRALVTTDDDGVVRDFDAFADRVFRR